MADATEITEITNVLWDETVGRALTALGISIDNPAALAILGADVVSGRRLATDREVAAVRRVAP